MGGEMLFDLLRTHPLGWATLVVFGSCLGSFVNVVIHRLPRGRSLIHPRSACPRCGRQIAWYDNLPLVSFLWLRGRCRHCQAAIALRYPVVELLGGGLTLLAVLRAETPLIALVYAAFSLALLAVVFIDFDLRIIPDSITLPGALLGLLVALLGPPRLLDALLGVLLGAGVPLVLALAYRAATGRDGLGMGDVKLMAMVGAFLGWQGASATLLLGSLGGTAVGVALMASRRGNRRTALPFGTFLAPAAWIVLFFGPGLWRWYLTLVTG